MARDRYERDEEDYGDGRWRGRDYDEGRYAAPREYGRTRDAGHYSEYDEGLTRGRVYDECDGKSQDATRVKNCMRSKGKLVGLTTDRDIVVRAIAEGKDVTTTRAEEIMTTDIHTAQPNDRVIDVVRKMGDKQVRRVPVVDRDEQLRGIISMADVALETNDDRELADALEEISSGSSFWNRIFG